MVYNTSNKLDTSNSTKTILSELDKKGLFNESDLEKCIDTLTRGKTLLVKTPFRHAKYELVGDV